MLKLFLIRSSLVQSLFSIKQFFNCKIILKYLLKYCLKLFKILQNFLKNNANVFN